MPNDLNLSEPERKVLALALEVYIRLGLGQFSEIAHRLDLIHGKRPPPERLDHVRALCNEVEAVLWDEAPPWRLDDYETSLYTLYAFLLEQKLEGNAEGIEWATGQIKDKTWREKFIATGATNAACSGGNDMSWDEKVRQMYEQCYLPQVKAKIAFTEAVRLQFHRMHKRPPRDELIQQVHAKVWAESLPAKIEAKDGKTVVRLTREGDRVTISFMRYGKWVEVVIDDARPFSRPA